MRRKKRNRWVVFALACIGTSLVIQTLFAFIHSPLDQTNAEYFNTLADFGAITAPLLNIAGFLMIYVAFQQQNKSMEQGRHEFELSYVENTFFNLINLYNEHINRIQDTFRGTIKEESNFFVFANSHLKKQLRTDPSFEHLQKVYQIFYQEQHRNIDHFVRHIFLIFSFIFESRTLKFLHEKEKKELQDHYLEIFKAQLSNSELLLLFYHLMGRKEGSMKTQIEICRNASLFQQLFDNGLIPNQTYWHEFQNLELDNL